MKKKIILIAIVNIILLSFTSCGDKNDENAIPVGSDGKKITPAYILKEIEIGKNNVTSLSTEEINELATEILIGDLQNGRESEFTTCAFSIRNKQKFEPISITNNILILNGKNPIIYYLYIRDEFLKLENIEHCNIEEYHAIKVTIRQ